MKIKNFITRNMEKTALLFVMLFSSVYSIAQTATNEVTTTGTTTTTTEEWYANPLYIAIGAILLIGLVALIARGGRNRNA